MEIWKDEQGEYNIYCYDEGTLHIIGGLFWFLLGLTLTYLALVSGLSIATFLSSFLAGICFVMAFFITAEGIQLRAVYEPNETISVIGYSKINILFEIFLPFLN